MHNFVSKLKKSVILLLTMAIVFPVFGNVVYADEGEDEEEPVVVEEAEIEAEEEVEADEADAEPSYNSEEELTYVDLSEYCFTGGGYGKAMPSYKFNATDSNVVACRNFIIENVYLGNYIMDVSEFDILAEDMSEILVLTFNERIDLYYMNVGYSYSLRLDDRNYIAKIYLNEMYDKSVRNAVDAKIHEIISPIDASWSDFDKALYVHDYIVYNTRYASPDERQDSVYDPTGVILNKVAVCQGYAEAYALIMNYVGVDTSVTGSPEMGHAWNTIKINGQRYLVDTTWDDPYPNIQGYVGHSYFLKSDEEFRTNLGHSGWITSYACTATNFDNAWWNSIKSQIYFEDGSYYYVERVNSQSVLRCRIGDTATTIYSKPLVYVPTGVEGYAYVYTSSLGVADGKFYMFASNHIYEFDPVTGEEKPVFEVYDEYIIEMYIISSNEAYVRFNTCEPDTWKRIYFSEVEPDPVESFCERLYTCCLGRDAEPEGKAYWAEALRNGATGAEAAHEFFFCPEFMDADYSNDEFVNRLYLTFMDRDPAPVETAYWSDLLTSGSATREDIFYGFVNSDEWYEICASYGIASGSEAESNALIAAFVERLYLDCLERECSQEEIDYWASLLKNNQISGRELAYQFFFSDEFIEHEYSDSRFLKVCYTVFFDRSFNGDEYTYWSGVLSSGHSREEVFYGFAESEEFAEICNEAGINP